MKTSLKRPLNSSGPLTPILGLATETSLLNNKRPIELIEDRNPDQFPKTKKIAKGMYSYFFVHFDSRKHQFGSLTHLDNFVLKELKTDLSSIRKQGSDLFIPLFHDIGRTHSNFQTSVANI